MIVKELLDYSSQLLVAGWTVEWKPHETDGNYCWKPPGEEDHAGFHSQTQNIATQAAVEYALEKEHVQRA